MNDVPCNTVKNNPGENRVEPLFPMISDGALPSEDSPMHPPRLDQPFVTGSIDTPVGCVPRVDALWTWRDHWGAVKARWGVGRMHYTVDPGLYVLGNPDENSQVLVTANYKMSFDRLRESLSGRSAWLMVLDTAGINVWCAAGKGTFGTTELIRRIALTGLAQIVSHRHLILPQLSGPGVAAHQVKKWSGFTVHYGPIRASDLPAYLDAGLKATPEMRLKTFPVRERIALIPIELIASLRAGIPLMLLFFLLGGIGGSHGYWFNAMHDGLFAVLALLVAILSGTIMTPVLLRVLPGRAFSIKGLILGLATFAVLMAFRSLDIASWTGRLEAAAWLFLVPAITAYLAMNFTGASTYTSLSGVKKEMRFAVPAEIGAALIGFVLWLVSRCVA